VGSFFLPFSHPIRYPTYGRLRQIFSPLLPWFVNLIKLCLLQTGLLSNISETSFLNFQGLSRHLPCPDLTRLDGILNLGAHHPLNGIAPDLGAFPYIGVYFLNSNRLIVGPKMYNAAQTVPDDFTMAPPTPYGHYGCFQ